MKFNTLSYISEDIGLRGNYSIIISKYANESRCEQGTIYNTNICRGEDTPTYILKNKGVPFVF